MEYQEFFKGKKVTQMGLGLLGRGVGDAEFLARMGVELTVTDLKTIEQLATSVQKLKGFRNVTFHLGGHDLLDFKDCDFVLKAAGVPLNSPFIAQARKNNIPIEMDASLFVKLAPKGVTIVGVTGTRGKSTVTHLIYEILKSAGKKVFLGGNVKDVATLPLLEKVKEGDFVVLELDSWQLQGFGDSRISPHISVFTNFMNDHLNYYGGDVKAYWNDKANIFKYQNADDMLVIGPTLADDSHIKTNAKIVRANEGDVKGWRTNLLGEHNQANIACAVAVARALSISEEVIQKEVADFKPVSGRLEFVREVNGVKMYNDTNATTPEATLAGLAALSKNKNVVLIMGGADKNLDMSILAKTLSEYTKAVILLKGTGSDRFLSEVKSQKSKVKIEIQNVESLKEALEKAMQSAQNGDTVLFSPAFASFGMFKNEYDRGEQFDVLVKNL